jgi:hypothetical protein|tara:strand:- start:195 stop:389 length:195 start_codon:yes stop_codon:yes gene_type:complete
MTCKNNGMLTTWSEYYQKDIYYPCGTTLPSGTNLCEDCSKRERQETIQSRLLNEQSKSWGGGEY